MRRSITNTNNVFLLVNPVYDIDTCIFKVIIFAKQFKYEQNTVFVSSVRVFNKEAPNPLMIPVGSLLPVRCVGASAAILIVVLMLTIPIHIMRMYSRAGFGSVALQGLHGAQVKGSGHTSGAPPPNPLMIPVGGLLPVRCVGASAAILIIVLMLTIPTQIMLQGLHGAQVKGSGHTSG